MRLSSALIRAGTFAAAAATAYVGSGSLVKLLEYKSTMAVQEALIDQGMTWSRVLGDGLQIIIEGEAPTEIERLRAVTAAGGVVDASRVINNISVKDRAGIEAPDFAVEILRNDGGVFLIGLIPAATDRETLDERIAEIAGGTPVSDLMATADYPVPEDWRASMNFALRALEKLPRSKISIASGSVVIEASSDSADQKRQLEQELRNSVPETVNLSLGITAPRPVVSPFITRFVIDEDSAQFDACTADTIQARRKIVAAALNAGFSGQPNCTLALGAPSRTWGDAVALAIETLDEIGGGTVTISDADVTLIANEGTDQELFDAAIGELDNALPEVFALEATLPVATTEDEEGASEFLASLSPEGELQLRGRVPDELTNMMVENFALAKFPGSTLTMGTLITEDMPNGWQLRVLAGLEGLSLLSHGSVLVEPDKIEISGTTSDEQASSLISGLLIEKLGDTAEFSVDVTYVEPAVTLDDGPTPEQCIEQIGIVTDGRKILFDPGSATLTAETQPIMDDIAEVLRQCDDLEIEIAGYTDSQGGEEMNARLSQQRASAVLSALRVRRVLTSNFSAVGYGEADPIADNGTEEGREANRRIEFRLMTQTAAEEDTDTETPDADQSATE